MTLHSTTRRVIANAVALAAAILAGASSLASASSAVDPGYDYGSESAFVRGAGAGRLLRPRRRRERRVVGLRLGRGLRARRRACGLRREVSCVTCLSERGRPPAGALALSWLYGTSGQVAIVPSGSSHTSW